MEKSNQLHFYTRMDLADMFKRKEKIEAEKSTSKNT